MSIDSGVFSGSPTSSVTAGSFTHEKGVFTTHNGCPRFIGSASGVHFLNTVRSTFFKADSSTIGSFEEQALLGEEPLSKDEQGVEGGVVNGLSDLATERSGPLSSSSSSSSSILLAFPPFEIAQQLVLPYFRYFHPLLPFLNGESFLSELRSLCEGNVPYSRDLAGAKMCILRAVFTIGLLDYQELKDKLDPRLVFKSASEAFHQTGQFMGRYNLECIKALMAIQVYLLASMSIRLSYELSAIVRSKLYLAGLHRCPARYKQFSLPDCDHRKRIFWSAYALERHLCQTLGLPVELKETDIDVCSLIEERHTFGQDIPDITNEGDDIASSEKDRNHNHNLNNSHPHNGTDRGSHLRTNEDSRILVARAFTNYSHLTGRIIEIFNKSVHMRSIDESTVLELRAEIEQWKNGLPEGLAYGSLSIRNDNNEVLSFENSCFFTVLYCHLSMLLNRPCLSLSHSSLEFKYAIQICINSSIEALSEMTAQVATNPDQRLFWPGYLSTVWMAGLILAYACRIGSYPMSKGISHIRLCLPLCEKMEERWTGALRCKRILEAILECISLPPENLVQTLTKKRPWSEEDEVEGELVQGQGEQNGKENEEDEHDHKNNRDNVDIRRSSSGSPQQFQGMEPPKKQFIGIDDFTEEDLSGMNVFDDVFDLFSTSWQWLDN